MTEVYIDLCKRLNSKVADISHIDKFNNQYEKSKDENPYNVPAVFIQFMPIADWITNADGSQTGTMKLNFHIETTCYSDTANAHKMNNLELQMSFKHLSIVGLIHKALQNYAPVQCTQLQRSGFFEETDHDQIQITIVEYSCSYTDNSTADHMKETVIVEPDLKVERPIERTEETVTELPTPNQFNL